MRAGDSQRAETDDSSVKTEIPWAMPLYFTEEAGYNGSPLAIFESGRRRTMTKTLAAALAMAWTIAGVNFAAEQTWTGRISDNLCNASHTKMATSVFPP